jgi:DNA modification methylase
MIPKSGYATSRVVFLERDTSTNWSFLKKGNWATHKGNYRGNWAPEIPRNIILRYSKEKDLVLDQMCGSGTTLVECKLTGRDGIGVDINRNALMIARDRLNFGYETLYNSDHIVDQS